MCVLGGRAAVTMTLPASRGKRILEVTGRRAPRRLAATLSRRLAATNLRLMSCEAQFSGERSQRTRRAD